MESCSNRLSPYFGECFDGYYCINLDRRVSRWLSVKHEFERVGIQVERISGFDSCYINDLLGLDNSKYPTIRTSEYAILLSHKLCWLKARVEGKKRIAVFEDDVRFRERFMEEWTCLYEGIPAEFDFLTLGTFVHGPFGEEVGRRVKRCNGWVGFFSYVIDLSVIPSLLPLLDGCEPIDVIVSNMSKSGRHYAIDPALVGNYKGWSDNEMRVMGGNGGV